MAAKLLLAFKQDIESFTLNPSDGGKFEVVVDGDLIYSKLETGRFPEEASIVEMVRAR
ncbi:MAG: SelT/SelW/SelH family protein [Acidobacteria bacterium]|nr:SelT/SelW/SelH family protein [Acidobacteriota bacterium]